jgi:hypothetical protein
MSTRLAMGGHDLAHEASGEDSVGNTVGEDRLHHQESVVDLGPPQDENARPGRLPTDPAERSVLELKQPAHRRREQLLEPNQGRLRAVDGRERVADEVVSQGRKLAHQEGPCLLLRSQVQLRLEERQFLAQEADVVQQEDLPVLQARDLAPGRGAAYIVDESDRPPQNLSQDGGVRLGRGVVLVLQIPALVRLEHQPGSLLRKFAHGRRAAPDAGGVAQPARGPVRAGS